MSSGCGKGRFRARPEGLSFRAGSDPGRPSPEPEPPDPQPPDPADVPPALAGPPLASAGEVGPPENVLVLQAKTKHGPMTPTGGGWPARASARCLLETVHGMRPRAIFASASIAASMAVFPAFGDADDGET